MMVTLLISQLLINEFFILYIRSGFSIVDVERVRFTSDFYPH